MVRSTLNRRQHELSPYTSGSFLWNQYLAQKVWGRGLADLFVPVFEVGLEVGHELAGVGAVHDAVIEAEGEVLDGADGDRVGAVLVRHHHRLLAQPADAQDGRLRLVDDRHAELLA